jgi:alkylation response protein AidB-like acyl-CoA dehydrogenase
MSFGLTPLTDAGIRFVSAAERLIPEFRERASVADREGAICVENFEAMQTSKVAAAFVPESLGGFGLVSVLDWLCGIAALARGDGSSAIGINMHLGVSRGMAGAYDRARRKGGKGEQVAKPLTAIAAGKMLICATATERGTDNLHPQTTATLTDDGWMINGHKMFVTMSPIATHLAMNLKMRGEDDEDCLGTVLLPIDTQGILPQDDWDSLGMRGSGSQSISFENAVVPKHSVRKIGPWGRWSIDLLINRTLGNLPLVAAFMGIAQHAHEIAMASLATQKRLGKLVNSSSGVQQLVGEMEIELATCQSILQRTGAAVDDWLLRAEHTPPTIEDGHHLMKEYQCAKWVVNRGAISIVDKAMDLVGGAGFMSAHPLTQLYRDVRAGPFMQPHAPTEIRGYVGQVALGLYPEA